MRPPEKTTEQAPSAIGGFDLQSVCWGYRDFFRTTLQDLYRQGVLGPGRPAVTSTTFAFLRSSHKPCFDHVLREFLAGLQAQHGWITAHPALYADVVDLGRRLADAKLYYGTMYFRILGSGGFGKTPAHVRMLMTNARRLFEIDLELAFSLIKGFHILSVHLVGRELNRYVDEALQLYTRSPQNACKFLECSLRSSQNVIRMLSRECRLADREQSLSRMVRALVGYDVEIADIGQLDSDELLDRGSVMVCMYQWLYVPQVIRYFDSPAANRDWYMLMSLVGAGMLAAKSFCSIHGHPDYSDCTALVGSELMRVNLLRLMEYARAARHIRDEWPGARSLLDFGIRTEFTQRPPRSIPDTVLYECITDAPSSSKAGRLIVDRVQSSVNIFDTAARLDDWWIEKIGAVCPELGRTSIRAVSFLPDFLYPAQVAQAPPEHVVADLKSEAERSHRGEDEPLDKPTRHDRAASGETGNGEPEDHSGGARTAYIYDEWNEPARDYFRDYCFVHEHDAPVADAGTIPEDIIEEGRKVRRLFERIRPQTAQKEKYLPDGDEINPERLLAYLVQRKEEPEPKINFYEKSLINRRDLAVLVLMDVSGSTGNAAGRRRVLEIEKQAALILGQGLNALGDTFAVCGFNGSGREQCDFHVYKDFDSAWNRPALARIWGARAMGATRIGAALRHAGFRLGRVAARQKLLILVTDGQPTDSDYSPTSRYAQYDVRAACRENRRADIHTFCISTSENSPEDMDIMFPQRRYAVLDDIGKLPAILPQLYVRLTL